MTAPYSGQRHTTIYHSAGAVSAEMLPKQKMSRPQGAAAGLEITPFSAPPAVRSAPADREKYFVASAAQRQGPQYPAYAGG